MAQRHAQPTALQTIEPSALVNEGMFSDTRVELIRNSVAKGAPNDVFLAMIDIAKRRNLDPLSKQIQVVQFGSSWQMITTIDGYRAIAEQTGAYAGSDAPVFTWPDPPERTSSKKLIPESATVTVWKLINGQRYPFSATVYWEEFNGGKNNWVSMPRVMLAKVAESHALRKAFPAVLSGTYTPEEMDQANAIEAPSRIVQAEPEVPAPQSPPRPKPTGAVLKDLREWAYAIAVDDADLNRAASALAKRPCIIDSMTFGDLQELGRKLKDAYNRDPDQFFAWLDSLNPDASQEAAAAPEPEPTPIRDDTKPIDTTPPTMDDIEAALAASTPVLPGVDVPEATTDTARFTR